MTLKEISESVKEKFGEEKIKTHIANSRYSHSLSGYYNLDELISKYGDKEAKIEDDLELDGEDEDGREYFVRRTYLIIYNI